jgi:hypothetical protein
MRSHPFLAPLLTLPLVFGLAAAPASAGLLRKATLEERQALTARYRDRHTDVLSRTDLIGICVHRAHPRYAAIFVNWRPFGGVEGTVFKRTRRRWRYVTGGVGWPNTGPRPVAQLQRGFKARCGRQLAD